MSRSKLWTTTHQPRNELSPEMSTLPRGVMWIYIGPIEQPDPDCSTPHRHGMVYFDKRQRLSGVLKLFPRTHAEPVRMPQKCFDYVNKTKAECLLEFGMRPDLRTVGSKTGVQDAVANALKEGATPRSLYDLYPGYVMMNYAKIDAMYNRIQRWNRSNYTPRRVVWLCGKTGVGKTRLAKELLPDAAIVDIAINGSNYFINGYANEESVIIDELRPGMPLCALLRLTDCNTVAANVKGGWSDWNAARIVITAPTPPDVLFPDVGDGTASDVKQLQRRIAYVVRLTDGDPEFYDGDIGEFVPSDSGVSRLFAYFDLGRALQN